MTFARRSMASDYLDFVRNNVDLKFNLAGSGIASCSLMELPARIESIVIDRSTSYGYRPLLEKIAKKYGVKAESIVTTNGTAMANHLAMAALVSPGDHVLIEEPAYEPILNLAHYLGAEVRRFPRPVEEGFRVNPDTVKTNLTSKTRLIVITNLHNPSSASVDDQTLWDLGKIAIDAGCRVLVDEVYLETVPSPSPLTAYRFGDHFVVTNSLTKAYGLGRLRCGWILCDPKLADRIWKLNDLFGADLPHAAELLNLTVFENLDWIASRADSLLKTNRPLLEAFLGSRKDLEYFLPQHGTTVFPRLVKGNVEELCDLLRREYDTTVTPGRFFEMPQHFRIGIGGSSEILAEGLNRLGKALDKLTS